MELKQTENNVLLIQGNYILLDAKIAVKECCGMGILVAVFCRIGIVMALLLARMICT